tara:strand:+ start:2117 stop:2326 length:210 start_codon:yes stop_codon:yes gene_type:complete
MMSNRSFGKVGKTYTNASEAFKDADYAQGIWKCETDFERSMGFFRGFGLFFIVLLGLMAFAWVVYPHLP